MIPDASCRSITVAATPLAFARNNGFAPNIFDGLPHCVRDMVYRDLVESDDPKLPDGDRISVRNEDIADKQINKSYLGLTKTITDFPHYFNKGFTGPEFCSELARMAYCERRFVLQHPGETSCFLQTTFFRLELNYSSISDASKSNYQCTLTKCNKAVVTGY